MIDSTETDDSRGALWVNDVTDMIDGPGAVVWADLVDALQEVIGPEEAPVVTLDDIELFRLWGPRVARFSFLLSSFAVSEITNGPPRVP